jgi:hypothetical protein
VSSTQVISLDRSFLEASDIVSFTNSSGAAASTERGNTRGACCHPHKFATIDLSGPPRDRCFICSFSVRHL